MRVFLYFIYGHCQLYLLSLHKIGCTRQMMNKFILRSLALSLHKIGCARQIFSWVFVRSMRCPQHTESQADRRPHEFHSESDADMGFTVGRLLFIEEAVQGIANEMPNG